MKPQPGTALALVPPPRLARIWLFVLAFAVPLLITGMALGMVTARAPQQAGIELLAVIALSVAIMLGVWFITARLLNRQAINLADGNLEITSALHKRRIALAELDLAQARVVNLSERTELRPRLRLFGMGLPGFRSGWFLLGNGRRGFVSMTNGSRVLWIPTRKGYDLLLELQQPQAALDQLRERI